MIPAAVLFFLMLAMPESPRWHILQANLITDPAMTDLPEKQRKINHYRKRRHYQNAFDCLCRLRHTRLQAARDLFRLDCEIVEEQVRLKDVWKNIDKLPNTRLGSFQASCKASVFKAMKFLTNQRCRRAMFAVLIVMVWQQLCGINVRRPWEA